MIDETSITGITILLFILLGYSGAWYAYQRGNGRVAIFLIVLVGCGLRIFCALDPMPHPWDERYHALVAKNMMTDPFAPKLYAEPLLNYDYKNWTANEIWLHKQPLPLWMMAASMKLLGVGTFPLRLPSVLLSTLSIFLTFWIGRFLSNSERVGLLAAFLMSVNGLVIELASGRVSTDHVDTHFMFFITLSVFYILLNVKYKSKKWLVPAGIACGLAILTKWLPGLIIFPLYIVMNFRSKKYIQLFLEMLLMGTVTILVAMPWQIYAHISFPLEYQWEQHYNTLHLTEPLEGHGQPWWYFIDRIRITINELVYLIFGWFVYRTWAGKTPGRESLFLLAWIVIPFMIFSLATTKMQGYLLFTFPAWFIITGMFAEHLWTANPVSGAVKKIYRLILGAIFLLAVRYGTERIKPFADQSEAKILKQQLTEQSYPEKTVIFQMSHSVEWMFYNEGVAYPGRPEAGVADSLRREGWLVCPCPEQDFNSY